MTAAREQAAMWILGEGHAKWWEQHVQRPWGRECVYCTITLFDSDSLCVCLPTLPPNTATTLYCPFYLSLASVCRGLAGIRSCVARKIEQH